MKALITGASSGIGRDMAFYLAEMGWDLILVSRKEDALNQVKSKIKSNVNILCLPYDLSESHQCMALYEKTKCENIDMLVNNAGFGDCGEFAETDLNKELQMINTNVVAVHILTKLFLQDFVKRNSGYILNTASSAGFMAGPMMATYYATKNYVVRLSEGIYEELRRKKSKVSISLLCPGPVATGFDKVANVNFSLKGLNSSNVAKYAIDNTLKKKLLIIPGTSMKLGKFGERLVSEKFMLKISYNIQHSKKQ